MKLSRQRNDVYPLEMASTPSHRTSHYRHLMTARGFAHPARIILVRSSSLGLSPIRALPAKVVHAGGSMTIIDAPNLLPVRPARQMVHRMADRVCF